MADTTTVHRPDIARWADDLGLTVYQMRCTCGARGGRQAARRMADWDRADHIAQLPAVPPALRCQVPREHDRRPWEPCPLCRDQQPLF